MPDKAQKKMIIAPMNKRITVRIEGPIEKTAGGIIIPDMAKDKEAPTTGLVLGISLDCSDLTKKLIKTGMKVVFSKYSGTDIHTTLTGGDEIKYQILKEEDILAVMVTDKDDLSQYIHIEVDDGEQEPVKGEATD